MSATQRNLLSMGNRKTIWIIALVEIFAMLGSALYWKASASTPASSGSQLQTEVIRRGDVTLTASGTGMLAAQTEASFGFGTSGQVTAVYTKIGDKVEKGQILAQLDDTLAQMKYKEAQQALQELYSAASIATVEQEIATATDTQSAARQWLEYLISPQVVEAEDNLALARQRLADAQAQAQDNPSEQADQQLKEKEGAVAFLTDKLRQAQNYYQNSYLPETFGVYENIGSRRHPHTVLKTELDSNGQEVPVIDEPSADDIAIARNEYIQAQQTVQDGELYLAVLEDGQIPEGATGSKLTILYEAQLAVENARLALDDTQLIAPISGTVTSLDLNIGQQAGTSSVITISQLSQPYSLDVYINAQDWDMAQAGNKVEVVFELLPEKTFPGTVALVYPELSPAFETSLAHLVVQLDSSLSQDLPAGTGATVDVVGGAARDVLIVPVSAIHRGEDGQSYVTVIQNGERTEREVEIGLKNDTYAEVRTGLAQGDTVVMK